MSIVSERTLPHNLEAEKCVLGAILINDQAFRQAAEVIGAGEFFRDAHRRIFEKMAALTDRGEPVDLVTLKDELDRSGELEDVGGPAYIAALTDGVPRSANVAYYSRIVKEKSKLRRVIQSATDAVALAYEGDLDGSAAALTVASQTAEQQIADKGMGLVNDVDILDSPEVPQIVTGLLSAKSLYGIIGPQGCGKTTVGMGLNVSLASGVPFLGYEVPFPGPSVYVLLEGQPLCKERVKAAKLAARLPLKVPIGMHLWLDGLDLLDPRSVGRFIAAARVIWPVNVTIDTWAMAFTGDENSSQDVGRGMRACQRIRDELCCAVGIVHHTNAGATRERGSTALKAALDTMLMLTVADDALRLVCEKQRDGAAVGEMSLRLTPVDGTKAQACRLAQDVLPRTNLTPTQERALVRLREDFVAGATSSEWRATLPEVPERSYYRVQAELVRHGYVATEGKGRNVRYRVAAITATSLPSEMP